MQLASDLVGLSDQLLRIITSLGDNGELTEDTERALAQLEGDIQHKVHGCARVVNALMRRETALRNEASQILAAAKRLDTAVANLRDVMCETLQDCGIPRIHGDLYTVSVQKSPPKVSASVEALDTLPDKYVVIEKRLNAKAILAAYKNGEELPAGVHVDQDNHVRIVYNGGARE